MIVAGGMFFAITKHDELVLTEAGKIGYRELGRVNPGIKLACNSNRLSKVEGYIYGAMTQSCATRCIQILDRYRRVSRQIGPG